MENTIISELSFIDFFNKYNKDIENKLLEIDYLLYNEESIFYYFKNYVPIINDNIRKIKNPINLPKLDEKFCLAIEEILHEGKYKDELHSPLHFSSMKSVNDFYFIPPEIIEYSFKNLKYTELWYNKLINVGYYISNINDNTIKNKNSTKLLKLD